MKPLEDKKLAELLKEKLSEVPTDVPIDGWDKIEGSLPAAGSVVFWKATLPFVFGLGMLIGWLWNASVVPALSTPNAPAPWRQAANTSPIIKPKASRSDEGSNSQKIDGKSRAVRPVAIAREEPNSKAAGGDFQASGSPPQNFVRQNLPRLTYKSGITHFSDYPLFSLILPGGASTIKPISTFKIPRPHPMKPSFLRLSAQLVFHTLRPFSNDENHISLSEDRKVLPSERMGYQLAVGYRSKVLGLTFNYGPFATFYRAALPLEINNSFDPSVALESKRLDAGLFLWSEIDARRLKLPGHLIVGLSSQWRLSDGRQAHFTYQRHILRYSLGYGFQIGSHWRISGRYSSFLKDYQIPSLGQLRPHMYSLGCTWDWR